MDTQAPSPDQAPPPPAMEIPGLVPGSIVHYRLAPSETILTTTPDIRVGVIVHIWDRTTGSANLQVFNAGIPTDGPENVTLQASCLYSDTLEPGTWRFIRSTDTIPRRSLTLGDIRQAIEQASAGEVFEFWNLLNKRGAPNEYYSKGEDTAVLSDGTVYVRDTRQQTTTIRDPETDWQFLGHATAGVAEPRRQNVAEAEEQLDNATKNLDDQLFGRGRTGAITAKADPTAVTK